MNTLVTVAALTHRFGHTGARTTVLTDVDLELEPALVMALTGRSGSGKSTLCSLIAGLDRPTAGSVTVAGKAAHTIDDWTTVSLLPQRLGLAEEFSVIENAFLPCLIRGLDPLPGLLETLALDHLTNRPVKATSLGEQQRIAIAKALSVGPRLAILDEPTGHQDDDNISRVLAAVALARTSGTAVIMATHDPRVMAVADRIVNLRQGRVIRDPA